MRRAERAAASAAAPQHVRDDADDGRAVLMLLLAAAGGGADALGTAGAAAGAGATGGSGVSEPVDCVGGPENGNTRAGGQLGGGGDARFCIAFTWAISDASWAWAGSAPDSPLT